MNNKFMQLAIGEAWKYQLHTYPNPAVGAAVVKNNQVLSVEAHHEAGMPHAEVNALKSAYLSFYPNSSINKLTSSKDIHNYLTQNHNDFFKECEIYVTLEPCNHIGKTPACAILLESIGIKKVYIGTLDPNNIASGGKQRLLDANIEVKVDICKEQTDDLLYPFVRWNKDNFIFFKLAMREDGSVDGGYITSQDSLSKVHEIRTKLDLMVISGQTVRVDRPTLDARFAKRNRSPDIFIYSKRDEFDSSIPLFNVPNREVYISKDLEYLSQNNFIMIEGGYSLLESLKDKIDCLVVFISHKEELNPKFNLDELGFKKVYSYDINDQDQIIFLF
jgi:diaminohydroxyphosphoribosylaminopyrimidine deaminase/5-amino-6-(5-phosphoribosylamino)uracil reductase